MRPLVLIALLAALPVVVHAEEQEPDAFDKLPVLDEPGEWTDALAKLVADGAVRVAAAGQADTSPVYVLSRGGAERVVRYLPCDQLRDWLRQVATPEPIESGGFVYEWRLDQLTHHGRVVLTDSDRAFDCPILDVVPETSASDDWNVPECPNNLTFSTLLALSGPWAVVERSTWYSVECGPVSRETNWSVEYVGEDREPSLEGSIDVASLKRRPGEGTDSAPSLGELLRSPHYFSGYDPDADKVEITFGLKARSGGRQSGAVEPIRYTARVTSEALRQLLTQLYPDGADDGC